MDKERKDELLALLQVEAQHRQRVDSIWTQYKDAMLVTHGIIFAMLGSLMSGPALNAGERWTVVVVTILIELSIFVYVRLDVEKSAAEVQADYIADHRAITGHAPARPLYSRAFKMRRERWRADGNALPVEPDSTTIRP